MRWICEDAGKALEELEAKIKEEIEYTENKMLTEDFREGKLCGLQIALDMLSETKENWEAVDDFDGV